ncbi:unnamed protein product [Cyclocybe aegerita]|uniref:Uncharacterized protein n=1 Tax=Cyclocybe aegerita TaxID=1973307 RepID=A0A8S0W550_CYCAE|nr:unnamed protein product [Cyclocybe aegerita]
MYETLLRPIEVFQIPQAVPVSALSEKLKGSERKREEKRQRQIRANKEKAVREGKRKRGEEEGAEVEDVDAVSKRPRKEDETGGEVEGAGEEAGEGEGEGEPMEEDVLLSEVFVAAVTGDESEPVPSTSSLPPAPLTSPSSQALPPAKFNFAKALPEVRGHTSYLTFACLVPVPAHAQPQPPVVSALPVDTAASTKTTAQIAATTVTLGTE